jgi:hypothetical protein
MHFLHSANFSRYERSILILKFKDVVGKDEAIPIDEVSEEELQKMSMTEKELSHWNDRNTQKDFFDRLAVKLGVDTTKPEQWNRVTKFNVIKRGGWGVLQHYNGSLNEALKASYPEYSAVSTKKERNPHQWKDTKNQRYLI